MLKYTLPHKFLIFMILTTYLVSCNQNKNSQFSLEGKVSSLKNGTMLYLECEEFKDSSIVEEGYFKFETILPKYPIQAVLKTKDYNQYRFIWLENKPMSFNSNSSNFLRAKITGSSTEELSQVLQNKIDSSLNEKELSVEIDFIKNNPNSIISASLLSTYATAVGKEQTTDLYEKFSKENKNSKYGKIISEYIKISKEPQIGDYYIDFEMLDKNGNSLKLSNFTNKITLLEFWSSWCGPCRKENPNLLKTYLKFKSKGFEIIAVSLDKDKNKWINAIRSDSLKWTHVSDLKGSSNKAVLIYGVRGIPDNFLIDDDGIIIGRNLRGEKLNQKLMEVLK